MADIAGEQPLTGQGVAQAPQGSVERHRQLAHFIGRVIRRQRRSQAQQLITMTHLARQTHHGGHDPAGQNPA